MSLPSPNRSFLTSIIKWSMSVMFSYFMRALTGNKVTWGSHCQVVGKFKRVPYLFPISKFRTCKFTYSTFVTFSWTNKGFCLFWSDPFINPVVPNASLLYPLKTSSNFFMNLLQSLQFYYYRLDDTWNRKV